jgi:hypothetical protein
MEDQQTNTLALLPIQNAMKWIGERHGREYLEQFKELATRELAIELLDYLKTCYEDQYIDTYCLCYAPKPGDDPDFDSLVSELEQNFPRYSGAS